ncbi:MAG: hypothetical protein MRK02_08915 [Candidatus Scalindua sp.]|nr:hypothetical protein [Candidatus Scalindua sp.]
MFSSKCLMQFGILLLLMHFCDLHSTVAHEGHDHSHDTAPVTIERATYKHFQSILSIYQETYLTLIKGESDSIPVLAQILLDTAGKSIETESKESGRHMMQHIYQGALRLRQAEDFQEIQEAFATISEAVLPFFNSWPNQLKSNKIKLYECREHEKYWLQPQDILPACPYASDKMYNCSDIREAGEE